MKDEPWDTISRIIVVVERLSTATVERTNQIQAMIDDHEMRLQAIEERLRMEPPNEPDIN